MSKTIFDQAVSIGDKIIRFTHGREEPSQSQAYPPVDHHLFRWCTAVIADNGFIRREHMPSIMRMRTHLDLLLDALERAIKSEIRHTQNPESMHHLSIRYPVSEGCFHFLEEGPRTDREYDTLDRCDSMVFVHHKDNTLND